MAISRFLFTAVMVGLAWNLNMNAVAEARELGVYEPVVRGEEGIIRIGGKPMVFYAGDGDMEDEIHYNSEGEGGRAKRRTRRKMANEVPLGGCEVA